MNILEAKEEIKATLEAYTAKDDVGLYVYPQIRQRPILLMGPPGVGKTAILQQIAYECKVGLVSYTMTHHTRQSAVGLPQILETEYEGEVYYSTRYTLSEIIASIYECQKQTGFKEGILFLDEINCVSETLSPVMLELLQNKRFGNQKVPEGWMIVAAGNPPEYNKSVREFDVATLDRVRVIQVEADVKCWLDYAAQAQVHGAVMAYLTLHPDRFFSIRQENREKHFVTARGWEDLSCMIQSREQRGREVTAELVAQYLQDAGEAAYFAGYYQIYRKYGRDYGVRDYLEGKTPKLLAPPADNALSLEERITVILQIADVCGGECRSYGKEERIKEQLKEEEEKFTVFCHAADAAPAEDAPSTKGRATELERFIRKQEESLKIRMENGLADADEAYICRCCLQILKETDVRARAERTAEPVQVQKLFSERRVQIEVQLSVHAQKLQEMVRRAFVLGKSVAGEETEEFFLLTSRLARNADAARFLSRHAENLL